MTLVCFLVVLYGLHGDLCRLFLRKTEYAGRNATKGNALKPVFYGKV